MTRTKRGSRGHLEREGGRSHCGRALDLSDAGGFHDEAERPTVCLICLRGCMKAKDFDHWHLEFSDGRWRIKWNRRQYVVITGGFNTYATKCYRDGCDHMVRHYMSPYTLSSGTISWTFQWYGAIAA